MKYTITVPAYKSAFLRECIDSILCQTFSDFELIILNDASPFDIDTIVKGYNDSRIRYYKNEKNCGAINVVDNWNRCLELAKGDYLICMGDDDRLLPNCLEEYTKLMEKYPGLGIYHGWTEIIDDNSAFYDITEWRSEYETVYSLIWHRWKGRRQFIGDFLFDISVLRCVGGFHKLPLAWGSDDITSVLCAKKFGIANTQTIVFQYRQNPSTITSTGNERIKASAHLLEMKWYETFLSESPSAKLDTKYWSSLLRELPKYFEKRFASMVRQDMQKKGPIAIIYWLRNKKKYSLSSYRIIRLAVGSVLHCKK